MKRCKGREACIHPEAVDGGWLPATRQYFSPSSSGDKYGLDYECKSCGNYRRQHPKPKKVVETRDGFKQCAQKETCVHPEAVDGGWLPATTQYFFKHKTGKFGLHAPCKACFTQRHAKTSRHWKETHPSEVAEYNKQYKSIHKDRLQVAKRESYLLNIDRERKYAKQYREANLERVKAVKKIHYDSHRDQIRQYTQAYYKDHAEERREYSRNYRLMYPDKVRQTNARSRRPKKYYARHNIWSTASNLRRRTRIRALAHDFTAADWEHALNYFDHSCAVCGKREDFWTVLAADHWLPVVKGGGTTKQNIVPLCHARKGVPAGEPCCNHAKAAKDPEAWLIARFGKRKAKLIAARIQTYFDSLG